MFIIFEIRKKNVFEYFGNGKNSGYYMNQDLWDSHVVV